MQKLTMRLQKILAKIQKQHTDAVLQLNQGASAEALQALADEAGVVLPQSLQDWYLACDGQAAHSENVFNRATWLSVAQMHAVWQQMQAQVLSRADVSVDADEEVQALWWHSAWLPFASAADGHCVCVDLAPTEDGQIGQIIRVSSTPTERTLEAASLEEWLEAQVEALEESDFVYSAKHGGVVDAEVLYAEEEGDMEQSLPAMTREQWQGMENDFQNTLNDLLGEGAPDLKSLVSGLLEDDGFKPSEATPVNAATAQSAVPSFKALFDEPQKMTVKSVAAKQGAASKPQND